MLEYVRDVRPFFESLDKSTGLSARAFVELKRRYRFDQALIEPRNLVGSDVLERPEANVAGDNWRKTPVIGPAKCPDTSDFQLSRVEFDPGFSCSRGQAVVSLCFLQGKFAHKEISGEGRYLPLS